MKKMYTDEINIQILISLLKKHNIKKVIVSPGTTHISFVASIQSDDFFEIYSCIDERSASYLACGLAAEANEPVIITCTGATASRNYMSGLTEAYYRKLPVIAITGSQHQGRIGQNAPQVLDRFQPLNDIVKMSVQVQSVYSDEDHWACNLNINKALLAVKRRGFGPIHINLYSTYSQNFNTSVLPDERLISRIEYNDKLPEITSKKVAIFIGSHKIMNDELINEIDNFCEKYNGVVLCDHTSNYHGKFRILPNLISDQINKSDLLNIDLLIHIGDVSGAYAAMYPKEVWRVNIDGEIRDTYQKLTKVFEIHELDFFKKYNSLSNESNQSYFEQWNLERKNMVLKLNNIDLPFSNPWVAKTTIGLLPNDCTMHFGILNSLRSWNYFDEDKIINGYCNTGGFGIDGILSAAIGASLNDENKIIYCVLGDLAFFYDINSLGNREIGKNLRIIVINNGCGTEFHNYNHRAANLNKEIDVRFVAGDGHYGNKSNILIKHYAEDLNFKYISATSKEEYMKNIDVFLDKESNQSIIFEIFTDSEDESLAIKKIHSLRTDSVSSAKKVIKKIVGEKNIKKIKKIVGK